jgi:hypothetical protein
MVMIAISWSIEFSSFLWKRKEKWSPNEELQLSFFALTKRGLFICDDAANMVILLVVVFSSYFSDHNIERIYSGSDLAS